MHPATQILIWCILVAGMQFLPPASMLVLGGLMLLLAFMSFRQKLRQLSYRTRWFMISLLLIYGYTIPGQALFDSVLSPNREGLMEGGLQLVRLLAALAGLAVLLGRLHRQKLMAGIYTLLFPLQCLGLSREKLALRLALTLQYAEAGMLRPASWRDSLQSLTDEEEGEVVAVTAGVFPEKRSGEAPGCCQKERAVELPACHFALQDALWLAGVVLVLWMLMR